MSNQIVKTYQYKTEERCIKCGKKLKTYKSRILGYGPSCYKKHIKEMNKSKRRGLFEWKS